MRDSPAITAIIAAHQRLSVLRTILEIKACSPAPQEIIVHVDGGCPDLITAISTAHPDVRILASEQLLGPGGSRHRMLHAATHEIVASFDDDAFPAHADYFGRVLQDLERHPRAAMLSAASMPSEWANPAFTRLAVPSGCACVFRRSWYLRMPGFIALPVAYGMEEADIGLQLHDLHGLVLHDPGLRARHEHVFKDEPVDLTHAAAVFANNALLMALRYPVVLWPLACFQISAHVLRQIWQGKWSLVAAALKILPGHVRRHFHHRRSVSCRAVLGWLLLKRRSPEVQITPVRQRKINRSAPLLLCSSAAKMNVQSA